jgi:hypothetical protein
VVLEDAVAAFDAKAAESKPKVSRERPAPTYPAQRRPAACALASGGYASKYLRASSSISGGNGSQTVSLAARSAPSLQIVEASIPLLGSPYWGSLSSLLAVELEHEVGGDRPEAPGRDVQCRAQRCAACASISLDMNSYSVSDNVFSLSRPLTTHALVVRAALH